MKCDRCSGKGRHGCDRDGNECQSSTCTSCVDCGGTGARKIRPEIRALIERGGITLAEWRELRGNSWEHEAIVPVLDDEAFAAYARHVLDNAGIAGPRPCASYREALALIVVPEALKRLERPRVEVGVEEVAGAADAFGACVGGRWRVRLLVRSDRRGAT